MAKKTKAPKKTTAPKEAKAKKPKPEQMKIPGTERSDSIPELEAADEDYREARDERMQYGEAELEKQELVTELMLKHGKTKHVYEGKDGKLHEIYIGEAKAKSRVVKEKKAKGE